MSGHNKWSTIKHKKGKADAARGKVFTKIIKEMSIAARLGGGDINSNPRLRLAVDKAKAVNMPKDNIDRAIKKGTGELEGVSYEEVTYEGYGPGGVAVIIEVTTDNKNRVVAEIRHLMQKCNGNLGENGCVSFMFDRKGVVYISKESVSEDKLTEDALSLPVTDIQDEGEEFVLYCESGDLYTVSNGLREMGYDPKDSSMTMIPKTYVELDEEGARRMMKLQDLLDDNDDVQEVYTNADISDEIAAKIAEE